MDNINRRRWAFMFTNIRKNNKGFTIVELLIVIVVIGLLAGLVLNTFQGAQARARNTERQTDVNALHTHLEVYFNDNGHYPSGGSATICGSDGATSCVLSTTIFDGLDAEALNDPSGNGYNVVSSTPTPAGGAYYYFPTTCTGTGSGQCTGYTLYADLEDESTDYTKSALN
jgi:prepilin-type N-terminal cleavage/methylation domain-containing protein